MSADAPTRRPLSPSWAEVDLAAIAANVKAVRNLLGPASGVWAVVKTNAYGHGLVDVAHAAVAAGAQGLAVATFQEGAKLRRSGVRARILLLCAGDPRRARDVVRLELIQTLCHEAMARALSHAAEREGRPARVHLKIDTGMGRLGIPAEEAAAFAQENLNLPGIHLEGVFSHLATAEADADYTRWQARRFREAVDALRAAGIDPGVRHLANSAATLRFPEMRLDAVRAGLLIYGISPESLEGAAITLRPALAWKTRLAFLHVPPGGSYISYGRTYVVGKEAQVGVLPLGYGDGYPRMASNRGYVLVRGRRCPVVGRVCMDHTLVDVTGVADAQIGDEVILIGEQGKTRITANQLARWAGTVVHETPTLIGSRVKRVYANGDTAVEAPSH